MFAASSALFFATACTLSRMPLALSRLDSTILPISAGGFLPGGKSAVVSLTSLSAFTCCRIAGAWKRQTRFRGQFSMPNLTIPELERACNLPDRDGLAKVSQIINAASVAINRPFATGLQELVNQLALR